MLMPLLDHQDQRSRQRPLRENALLCAKDCAYGDRLDFDSVAENIGIFNEDF